MSTQFVVQQVANTLSNLQAASYQQIEATLYLVYLLPEGNAQGFYKRVHLDPYLSIFRSLVQSDVSRHPHKAVATMYLEVLVKYARILEAHPEFLAAVVTTFFDNRGALRSDP